MRSAGIGGSENADMSSESAREIRACRKSKVSEATFIGFGLIGSNRVPYVVHGMYKPLIFGYLV